MGQKRLRTTALFYLISTVKLCTNVETQLWNMLGYLGNWEMQLCSSKPWPISIYYGDQSDGDCI